VASFAAQVANYAHHEFMFSNSVNDAH
jgi:hypothetical protein